MVIDVTLVSTSGSLQSLTLQEEKPLEWAQGLCFLLQNSAQELTCEGFTGFCYAYFSGVLFRGKLNLLFLICLFYFGFTLLDSCTCGTVLLRAPCLAKCPGDFPVPDVMTAADWQQLLVPDYASVCLAVSEECTAGVHGKDWPVS